jgi:hypothetical protein
LVSGTAKAFLLSSGPGQFNTSARLEAWRDDLRYAGVETEVDRRLKAWTEPKILPEVSVEALQCGTTLKAELKNQVGRVVAYREFTLGNDPMVDILLVDTAK